MRIEVEIRDDVCMLRLKGRFIAGSDAASAGVRKQLATTGCRKVIADCRETPYLDATGVGFIVELYKSLRDAGGQFVLANVNPRIREVLAITKIDDIIPVYDDEEAAFAALNEEKAAVAS